MGERLPGGTDKEGVDNLLGGGGGVIVQLREGGGDLLGTGGVVQLHLHPRLPQEPANIFLQLRPLPQLHLLFQRSHRSSCGVLVIRDTLVKTRHVVGSFTD